MERGDNFMQSVFEVELFFGAWMQSAEHEQKASSKPSLSCVRSFTSFFSPSLKHLVLPTGPIFLKGGGKKSLSSTAGSWYFLSSSTVAVHST